MGKSLPRIPIGQIRLYPNLSAVKEVIEPISDEVCIQEDPNILLKQKRTVRTRDQPRIRASERLKEHANQKTKTVEIDPGEDTYLHSDGDPKSGKKTKNSKAPNLYSIQKQRKTITNIEDRVENNLTRENKK